MNTALKIIFGILIGVGVVAFWPVIIAVVYAVGVLLVTIVVAGGQLIFGILIIIGFCLFAWKFGQFLFCRKEKS